MTLTTLPLAKLHLSPMNVRQTGDGDDTSDLEASILAHGMLSHLIVHKLPQKRGHYGVLAGGRRLRALQRLRDRGQLDANHSVDVEVRDEDAATATEISIIENTARVALPPVEEFQAFAKLQQDGADVAAIATRFGCTELHVRQRMRLGQLHPEILDELAAGRLSLDVAKAYAATTDLALQKRVFDQRLGHAYEVRAALNRDLVNAGVDRMLQLVTLEEYVAGGGRAEPDLFMAGEIRIENVDVLRELYEAKLLRERARLKLPEHVSLQFDHGGIGQLVEIVPELTDAQQDRIFAIDERLAEIDGRLEDIADYDSDGAIGRYVADAGENQGEVDNLVAEGQRLRAETEAIASPSHYPEGALIAVAKIGGGRLQISGFYRPFGWRAAPIGGAASTSKPAAARSSDMSTPASTPSPRNPAEPIDKPVISAFRSDRLAYSGVYQQPETVAREQHGLSKDAIEVMRSIHRMTLGTALLGSSIGQRLAADYLIFVLARGMLRRGEGADTPADLGVDSLPRHDYDPAIARDDLAVQPGTDAQRGELERVREQRWMTEKDPAQALRFFINAPQIERTRAAAAAAVMMLARSLNAPGYVMPVHQVLAELLNIDDLAVRETWTPDERFFERLPKARQLEAIREVDSAAADRLKNLGLTEMKEAAAAIMVWGNTHAVADNYGLSEWSRMRSRNWVPPYLSFRDLTPASEADEVAA